MESAMGHWSRETTPFSGPTYITDEPEELAVRAAPRAASPAAAPAVAPPVPNGNGTAPAPNGASAPIQTTGTVTPLPTARPAAPGAPRPAVDPSTALQGDERLAQVRELIFGNEMRTYERRFAEVEERLAKRMATLQTELIREIASLRQSLEPRLTTLERGLEAAGDLVAQAQDAARETVDARVRDMRVEFMGYRKTLEQTMAQIEERVAKGGRQLTQEIVELRNQTAQQLSESSAEMVRRLGSVEGRMTDREALVRGLAELARGLVGTDPRA